MYSKRWVEANSHSASHNSIDAMDMVRIDNGEEYEPSECDNFQKEADGSAEGVSKVPGTCEGVLDQEVNSILKRYNIARFSHNTDLISLQSTMHYKQCLPAGGIRACLANTGSSENFGRLEMGFQMLKQSGIDVVLFTELKSTLSTEFQDPDYYRRVIKPMAILTEKTLGGSSVFREDKVVGAASTSTTQLIHLEEEEDEMLSPIVQSRAMLLEARTNDRKFKFLLVYAPAGKGKQEFWQALNTSVKGYEAKRGEPLTDIIFCGDMNLNVVPEHSMMANMSSDKKSIACYYEIIGSFGYGGKELGSDFETHYTQGQISAKKFKRGLTLLSHNGYGDIAQRFEDIGQNGVSTSGITRPDRFFASNATALSMTLFPKIVSIHKWVAADILLSHDFDKSFQRPAKVFEVEHSSVPGIMVGIHQEVRMTPILPSQVSRFILPVTVDELLQSTQSLPAEIDQMGKGINTFSYILNVAVRNLTSLQNALLMEAAAKGLLPIPPPEFPRKAFTSLANQVHANQVYTHDERRLLTALLEIAVKFTLGGSGPFSNHAVKMMEREFYLKRNACRNLYLLCRGSEPHIGYSFVGMARWCGSAGPSRGIYSGYLASVLVK